MKRTAIVATAGLLIVGLAGCGGTGSTTSQAVGAPTSTPAPSALGLAGLTPDQQGAAYLAAEKGAVAALETFLAWGNDDMTFQEIAVGAKPVIKALDAMSDKLVDIPFTGPAAADVRTLLQANGALVGTFRAVGAQNANSMGSFATSLGRDTGAWGVAVDVIRADLALPKRG